MEYEEIHSFLDTTADKLESCWDVKILSHIANQRVPDLVMSGRGTLLRADIHLLWTQWFLESICDPNKFINSSQGYAHIFKVVQQRIPFICNQISESELQKLTIDISRLIAKEVERRKTRKRIRLDIDKKKLLWDIQGLEPRCWICGYKFTNWAENKFLGYSNCKEVPLPRFVDYMTLHGLKQRDVSVEIDHAVPFSKGGTDELDNLRLSCGWCNCHKSDRLSIYDVTVQPQIIEHPKFGKQSIPHPFWVVRLLSIRRRCEYEGNCDKTVNNSQLTLIYKHPEGAMNPANLKVICQEHDPLGSSRLISRDIAEQMR
ncbi:HNH endonuclease [Stanieria cyanosphaera PCC 7437]|uniref:HNH endonuclease n=1 Tax=Stanieria cyanosphaera (strain ATCC 29371 / PCC 7437) TaxID=111780 RepID=K9XVE2_STAC7|nr:HNH endonuclease signature motif containing protein [Stanieria cyanosphaera]AFZ36046.1 HNH endonuclease [Stanieria cyanosphaera PCC 7437]